MISHFLKVIGGALGGIIAQRWRRHYERGADETLQMMRFAEATGGDIKLTETGLAFADAPLDERKRIFARQLLK